MSDQIAKGEEFEKKAEKKIKGWGLFGSKYEDAAELYEKSANSFKLAKSYAISCLDQAVNIFLDIGRHNMAAKHCKEIGELYEPEHNIEKAIVYFERAAELFEHAEATTSANQCKQKVAEFSAQLEQYQKAIVIYEEIARQSINNNLLKYGVRGHLLNAGLCQLCRGDIVAITNALERYQDLDPTFSRTREYKFLADVAATVDEEDIVKFTNVVREFDSMTPLDPWKTTLLLRVKESLKSKELEEEDLT
ncbi:alpha-soluble nsf attachment protein [Quercus suber]|uniref:Alpha-soluble nsf attachment protein n=1 Tax=Quercus suber TaxID=58331 RepID=A0AAW0K8U7_QUESU